MTTIAKSASHREAPSPAILRYMIVTRMRALAARPAIGITLRFSIELRSLANAIRVAAVIVLPLLWAVAYLVRKIPFADKVL